MSSVCQEGQPPPVAVVHCNDLRSEHRSSVIAVRPPSRDQSPCPAMRTCRHHWRMLRHSTAEETSNPGGRSPSRCLKGTCSAAAVDGPRGRPIPQDGQPNSEAGLVFHHSWRRTLTQCRARYHISIHPRGWMIRTQAFPFGTGIGLCLQPRQGLQGDPLGSYLLGGRRTRVSILLPCGERTLLRALVWLCGLRLTERSGVDTTHRPGGSRALSSIRATRSPTIGLLVPGSPPLQWCRDD